MPAEAHDIAETFLFRIKIGVAFVMARWPNSAVSGSRDSLALCRDRRLTTNEISGRAPAQSFDPAVPARHIWDAAGHMATDFP